jgi:hypothetical protein
LYDWLFCCAVLFLWMVVFVVVSGRWLLCHGWLCHWVCVYVSEGLFCSLSGQWLVCGVFCVHVVFKCLQCVFLAESLLFPPVGLSWSLWVPLGVCSSWIVFDLDLLWQGPQYPFLPAKILFLIFVGGVFGVAGVSCRFCSCGFNCMDCFPHFSFSVSIYFWWSVGFLREQCWSLQWFLQSFPYWPGCSIANMLVFVFSITPWMAVLSSDLDVAWICSCSWLVLKSCHASSKSVVILLLRSINIVSWFDIICSCCRL